MRKAVVITWVCAGCLVPSPAVAGRTVVVEQVADIDAATFDHGRSYTQVHAPSLAKVQSGDVVEGTMWFRGGHVRADDPATFFLRGALYMAHGSMGDGRTEAIWLLNAKGEAFGERRWQGDYSDGFLLGAYAPGTAAPVDVFGLRYRNGLSEGTLRTTR